MKGKLISYFAFLFVKVTWPPDHRHMYIPGWFSNHKKDICPDSFKSCSLALYRRSLSILCYCTVSSPTLLRCNRREADLVSFIWIGWAASQEGRRDLWWGRATHFLLTGRPTQKKRPSTACDDGKKYCTLCYLICQGQRNDRLQTISFLQVFKNLQWNDWLQKRLSIIGQNKTWERVRYENSHILIFWSSSGGKSSMEATWRKVLNRKCAKRWSWAREPFIATQCVSTCDLAGTLQWLRI